MIAPIADPGSEPRGPLHRRAAILARRRRVQALDARLPWSRESVRRAAWAGLQDSMPRAALLSIAARIAGTRLDALDDPALVQVWGPRYSAYVVAAEDVAVFTLGRLADSGARRVRAEELAARLDDVLDGRELPMGEVADALGLRHPNALRYAAPAGRLLIRWDGARRPTVRPAPAPRIGPADARLELARRHLGVFGPTTPGAFAEWAGITRAEASAAFDAIRSELARVRTPLGTAWILAEQEAALTMPGEPGEPPAAARLLPSGDAFFLLQGAERELLIPDPGLRSRLWTPRVWPGAVLVRGEVAGTWRRAGTEVDIEQWRPFSTAERDAVEAEAIALPLPGADLAITVRWAEAM